jgi:Tfp pilus assembly protein PilZ
MKIAQYNYGILVCASRLFGAEGEFFVMASKELLDPTSLKAQIKQLLRDLEPLVDSASVDQQRRLLSSLRDVEAQERRRHPRKNCSIPVTVGTWRIYREFIKNISRGGMFIETDAPFSAGERITLTFSYANQPNPLRITARVVRRTSRGIGVEFTTLPNPDLEKIIESL